MAGQGDAGQQTNMLGQPTGAPAAPQQAQQPATFDQLLAANPHLVPQYNAMMQYALAHQRAMYEQQRQPAPQQGQPAAPAGPALNAFGVPKFDKTLMKYITEGPNGDLQVSPYAPPGTLHAYEQYVTARREAFERLLDDPEKALEGILEKYVAQRGPQIADQRIQGVQTQAYVGNFLNDPQNSWLYQPGVTNWNGQKKLSEAGQYFYDVVRQLDSMGVKDPTQQVAIGRQLTYAALSQAQQRAAAAAQQNHDAGKQNLLNQAPNFAVSPPTPQGNTPPADNFVSNGVSGNKTGHYRSALEQAFAAAGVNGILT